MKKLIVVLFLLLSGCVNAKNDYIIQIIDSQSHSEIIREYKNSMKDWGYKITYIENDDISTNADLIICLDNSYKAIKDKPVIAAFIDKDFQADNVTGIYKSDNQNQIGYTLALLSDKVFLGETDVSEIPIETLD